MQAMLNGNHQRLWGLLLVAFATSIALINFDAASVRGRRSPNRYLASFWLATVGTFIALCAWDCYVWFRVVGLRLKISHLRFQNLVLRKRLLRLTGSLLR